MDDVLLAVGTQKGLFLGRRDGRSWAFTGPHFPMQAVLLRRHRHPRGRTAAAGRRATARTGVLRSSAPTTWARPGTSRPRPAVRFPEDTGDLAGAGLAAPSGRARRARTSSTPGTEPGALFRSEDGGETFDLRPRPLGAPAARGWAPATAGRPCTPCVTDPRDAGRGDRRRLHRRGVPHGGRRRELAPVQQRACRRTSCPRSSVPGVRPVRAQGRARTPPTPTGSICRTTAGVYRSDDGGATVARHRRRPARRLRLRRGRPPAPRRTWPTSSRSSADADRLPRRPPLPRLPHRGRRRRAGRPLTDGLPQDATTAAVLRDAMCTDDADPAGVYFGNRNGEVYASADEGDTLGDGVAATCRTCCAYGRPVRRA